MKILFLTNKVPYPPKDGGAIASMAMINSFACEGFETTVLAMNTRKHHVTPWDIPDEITNRTILHLVEVPAPITIKGLFMNFLFSKLPYNAERFIDKKFRTKLELLLTTHSYDIIQLEGLYLTPYIPVIRKLSKSLVVYRSHNIEHEIWERTSENAKGVKKMYLKDLSKRIGEFEKNAINGYDLLVPITERDETKLTAMGNNKPCMVVPAGIDAIGTVATADFEMNLFYIGALDWLPNQEGLLWFIEKCLPAIKKKYPEIVLKVAGRNAPEWLKKKLDHPNVCFLGEIDNAVTYMQHNGVMIVPLFSGSGMRVKIIEGMSLSKAIVTTTIGCEGIAAENGVDICIADNPADYAACVISLLADKNKIIEMGEKASGFVSKHYDNRTLIRQLAEFYKLHLK